MDQNETALMDDFHALQIQFNHSIPKPELEKFVKNNFKNEILGEWTPTDFNDFPLILNFVQDPAYR